MTQITIPNMVDKTESRGRVYHLIQCTYIPVRHDLSNTCMYMYNLHVCTGHSELTSRFTTTCATAVEWVVYGAEHFTADHTHHFLENEPMPIGVTFDSRASIAVIDVKFTKYLLQFFYRTLVPVVRKVCQGFVYVKTFCICRQGYVCTKAVYMCTCICVKDVCAQCINDERYY